MNFPLNLIILGPQGSGKGTQGELLVQKFGYSLIGMGGVLREIAKQDSEFGRQINQIINVEGRLVEGKMVARVIQEKIKSFPQNQPIIIDGYPRTLEQYELLKKFWPRINRGDFKVIYIELSDEAAMKRLSIRFVCKNCGEICIGNGDGICKKCGGKLIQRPDDRPEALEVRLKLFNQETLPMITEMEKDGKVVRIDGRPSIPEVHKEILEKLELCLL